MACEQPANNNNNEQISKFPTFTIRNESSFVLSDVKFSGISFSIPNSHDLQPTTQSVQQLTENEINKSGYITFVVRKDFDIACRTEVISVMDQNITYTIHDSTVVEEQGNSSNRNSLSQLTFLSKLVVEHNGLPITKNGIVNVGEIVTDKSKEIIFFLKNTGSGVLRLTGANPVKISSLTNAFTVTQPSKAEIAQDNSLIFSIKINATEIGNNSATVTVSSNDHEGDFIFTITAIAVPPLSIATVFCDDIEIFQNGMIDTGELMLTLSKNINITIKNTGTESLFIDTKNITITGSDETAFVTMINPNENIPMGGQSSLIIECKPDNLGEKQAVLTIPTNDNYRNPIIVYLRAIVSPLVTCTVTYDANGGIGKVPVTHVVTLGSVITLPDGSHLSNNDLTFGGWNTSASGIGTNYNANASYTVTDDIILYAKWEIKGMVLIPAGTFIMGSSLSEPLRVETMEGQCQVTLTRSFYMGKYEVSQSQYEAVIGNNPSTYKGINLPVVNVSWYDVMIFCNKLSIQDGLDPVYSIYGKTDPSEWGTVPVSSDVDWNSVVWIDGANGYRLPTEAEWEYACRAGTTTAFNWGTDRITTDQANFNGNSYNGSIPGINRRQVIEVGSFAPNAWGLYDLHGNVEEWCWDWTSYHYDWENNEMQTDPQGPVLTSLNAKRITRGGSWADHGQWLRSAYRSNGSNPSSQYSYLGFRIVREAKP